MKKFYIIIIDSGWPTAAHEALQKSKKLLKEYLERHKLIIFSEEESIDFFKENTEEIGKGPIIIIVDDNPKKICIQEDSKCNGIRIDLGKIHDKNEALGYLQEICRLINNDRFMSDVSWEERKKISREILKDLVKDVVREYLKLLII